MTEQLNTVTALRTAADRLHADNLRCVEELQSFVFDVHAAGGFDPVEIDAAYTALLVGLDAEQTIHQLIANQGE